MVTLARTCSSEVDGGVPVARARGCDQSSGRLTSGEVIGMIFEIRIADGAEAKQLKVEQARVLYEVTQWVAQRRSENGQDRAA